MRLPTRNQVYYVSWGTAGLALLFAGIVLISGASTDLLSLGLAVSSLSAFVGIYTFVVTRRLSEFGSRVALVCLVVGWVSVALLESIRLDGILFLTLSYSLLVIGIMGFVYIVFVEIPITMPKKPGSSRSGRLLNAGFLLIVLGSGIAFARWFALPISRELYLSFFSPLSLIGKASFVTGIVLFSLAVLRARKHYVSERNRDSLRPAETTNAPDQSKS